MNRKEVIAFCNTAVFPAAAGAAGLDPIETVRTVEKWRRKNGYPDTMTAEIENGFLFLNGSPAGRIAQKTPGIEISEKAAYYEGKCIR